MPNLIAPSEAKYGDAVTPYWKAEEPTIAMIGAVMLRHFRNARKLQVIETYFGKGTYRRFGPRAVIDLDELANSDDARTLLRSLLDTIENSNDGTNEDNSDGIRSNTVDDTSE